MSNSAELKSDNLLDKEMIQDNGGDFTIVTCVEDDSPNDPTRSQSSDRNHKLLLINPVYDASDELEDLTDHIHIDTHPKSHGNQNGLSGTSDTQECIDGNSPDQSVQVNTVSVDNQIVELRSPNHDIKDRQSRPPTWKRNQKFVSEAFGFLKELECGDTDSVIENGHICEEGSENCEMWNSNQQSYQTETDQSSVDTNMTENVESSNCRDTKMKRKRKEKTIEKSPEGEDNSNVEDCLNGDDVVEEADMVGDLPGPRRRLLKKKPDISKDDDPDSSDEDTGVYRESFRKSTWLYIGDNEEIKQEKNIANYISLADLGVSTCDNDSIFGENIPSSELPTSPDRGLGHKRNESTTTTLSEHEFRKQYNSVNRRMVQRADSRQEYKRLTAKCYDNMKMVTLHRETGREFGIHVLNSSPAIISGIDAGSAAESAGLKEGQVVISVNGVNVLEASHEEILDLVHRDSTSLTLEVGSGDMTGVQDLQEPLITGYLKKQVTSTILRTWKRRYFILRKDDCLYYYKNEKESDPLGAIPLSGYTVSRYGDLHKLGFRAEKYNAKTFYFMAETREDMANWVGYLNEAAKRGCSKDSWMDVTAQNVGLPALNIRNPDCSGYLFKIGRATRRWRKRYCVLKDACIYYYKGANSKQAEGVAHLHGYSVEVCNVSGKKHSFNLRPPEPQMRTFSFYTDNDTDKQRWVLALSTSIKKWIKVD